METPSLYIKFGHYEHIVDLYQNGVMYCQSLHYFTKVEDNNTRGDKDENCIKMNFGGEGILTVQPLEAPDSKPIKIKCLNAHYKEYINSPVGNLFCPYMLPLIELTTPTPMYNLKCNVFGSHFLLINNSLEFMRRVKIKLGELDLDYEMDIVKYLDLTNYSGNKSYFIKDSAYAYQREFRILVKRDLQDPFILNIGGLQDIAQIFESPKIPLNYWTKP